jgi:hypothetical protein
LAGVEAATIILITVVPTEVQVAEAVGQVAVPQQEDQEQVGKDFLVVVIPVIQLHLIYRQAVVVAVLWEEITAVVLLEQAALDI